MSLTCGPLPLHSGCIIAAPRIALASSPSTSLFRRSMARRKQDVDDGYSSDSASASSSASHTEGWQRKRKRKSSKEDAIYGIFGSGSEGENERAGGTGRTVRAKDAKGRRVDFLKGQSFVPASASPAQTEEDQDVLSSDSSSSDQDGELAAEERMASKPGTEMEEMETRNPFALGPTAEAAAAVEQQDGPDGFRPSSFMSSRAGIGARNGDGDMPRRAGLGAGGNKGEDVPKRGGIGASGASTSGRAGIGSNINSGKPAPTFTRSTTASEYSAEEAPAVTSNLTESAIPTAFGSPVPSAAFTQRKSQAQSTKRPSSFATPPATSIKFGGGMGGKFDPSKYLAQMGWTGGGLGTQGEGIVNPIEVKQRPERAGIAFGGIREKTKQAKEEARRRGEDVSTDEEERETRKKGEKQRQRARVKAERAPQAWTQTEKKPRKPKVEHRTYEQILEELGQAGTEQAGLGQILDAAGNEYGSLSAALARHSVPTNESTNLIEIRHNLRLICEGNQSALQMLAKEGASILEKHKWLLRERDESHRRGAKDEVGAKRMKSALDLVRQLEALGRKSQADSSVGLDSFDGLVQRIISEHQSDVAELHLDEAVVGAIVPVLRKQWSQWRPLDAPGLAIDQLKHWVGVLRIEAGSDVMTPYESLLWNLWMPPVRSALNNDWDVYKPARAVELYQAWKPLLSSFIADNLTQQLILPKLSNALADWDKRAPLHRALFPWMALLGEQMDDVVAEAKRQLRGSLKTWNVAKGVPANLTEWREARAFTSNEWNALLLGHVVPKLSSHLDVHLVIDPKAQDLGPLECVLAWRPLMPSKIISKLLLAKFIPKWLHVLHSWLVDPRANLEEVAGWYEHWKGWLESQQVGHLASIQEGLQLALQLMSHAVEMGADRVQLPAPNIKALQARAAVGAGAASSTPRTAMPPKTSSAGEPDEAVAASFRTVVEEAMMEADLIMQSLNQREPKSRLPLFRVSKQLDGRGGVTMYLDNDVVFAETRQDGQTTYEPVSLADLVQRASGM